MRKLSKCREVTKSRYTATLNIIDILVLYLCNKSQDYV
jgi:hypothetical protein